MRAPTLESLKTKWTHNPFNVRRLSRQYREDERGIAAIEFAIIAPIMIGMYFGLAEIASAISIDRRISHSANVAGDLSTQQPELKDEDIVELISAALRVMGVEDASSVSMDIHSYMKPGADDAPESRGLIRLNQSVGNFPALQPDTIDANLLNERSGVVVTRVSYEYTPLKLRYFDSDITLTEKFLHKPRRSDAVIFQDGKGSIIDCTATTFKDVTCSVTAAPST